MKKLFVIASRVPFPLDKGDKLRLYHQLTELHKKYEIHLCVLDDAKTEAKALEELKSLCSVLEVHSLPKWKVYLNLLRGLIGTKPFQVYYFYQRGVHRKIKKSIANFQPDYIYCQLIRSAEYVKNEHQIPKTIDYMDAFSKGIERRIDTAGLKKKLFQSEYKRLVKYENLTFDYFEHHTIISNEDKKCIMHESRDVIKIVQNGIDTDYFTSVSKPKKYDLLFVGNMSYAPNVDSVVYFVNKILPLLIAKKKDITFYIAGANPLPEVLQLAGENVIISGWIEDIRDAYNESTVFVAAMNIGTGLQNKLLEAMAMELPCVTSQLANKALGAKEGQQILISKNEKEYVDHITQLLSSDDVRKELGVAGRCYVKENFSWKHSSDQLSQIIESSTK
ncbi:MAG: sugar transferase (PEP-CTERM/EpsH1 system associated) [Flavobacteriales bacterium]|jgi:sugar transferase (PEP-CTERM/EpsH1 system associated)